MAAIEDVKHLAEIFSPGDPDCPRCGGLGWVCHVEVRPGGSWTFDSATLDDFKVGGCRCTFRPVGATASSDVDLSW